MKAKLVTFKICFFRIWIALGWIFM